MTQFRRYAPAPRQSTGALTAKLVALAAAATLAIGGLIATEMAAGEDPALGPKAAAQAKKASTSSARTEIRPAGRQTLGRDRRSR